MRLHVLEHAPTITGVLQLVLELAISAGNSQRAAPDKEVTCALTMLPAFGAADSLEAAWGSLVVKSRKCLLSSTCNTHIPCSAASRYHTERILDSAFCQSAEHNLPGR